MSKVPPSLCAASMTPINSSTLGMPQYVLTNIKFKLWNVCEVEPLSTYRNACNITQMEQITTANKYFFSNWTLGVEHLHFFHAIRGVTGQCWGRNTKFGISNCNLHKTKGPEICYKTKILTYMHIKYQSNTSYSIFY
jgi:hypothetical protein